ncbi:hypothetical protein AAC387_Pa03g3124 [Persea americana]
MAGWISSKLKVAESFLQQIDQQAAESLRKNEKTQLDDIPNYGTPTKSEVIPLKDQLKKKPPQTNSFNGNAQINLDSREGARGKELDNVRKPISNPASAVADGDWTELLSSHEPAAAVGQPNGVSALQKEQKRHGIAVSSSLTGEKRTGFKSRRKLDENKVNSDASDGDRRSVEESSFSGSLSRGGSDLSDSILRKPTWESQAVSNDILSEPKDVSRNAEIVGISENGQKSHSETHFEEIGAREEDKEPVSVSVNGIGDLKGRGNDDHGRTGNAVERGGYDVAGMKSITDELPRSSSSSDGQSDSGSDSGSTSESENENERRIEKRKRREQIRAEKAAAKAVEAIKERENIVARLEGEKQTLEKILDERSKQQAQEASELQMNMMETMEAVELEKQKHNSTRMEALARLAKLETTNAELAKSLATTQWNLEVEVNQVAELRRQIELKEVAHEELRRRISNARHGTSLSRLDASKGVEFEREILEAEYSLMSDKIRQLQEKAKELEENIEVARREMEHPTEVEVELKKRLAKLTDHLIQKQAQVESLSSEKAMLLFRLETVSRLIDESKVGSLTRDDIEAGKWEEQSDVRLRPVLRDRIRSGRRHLGSILRQLDAIFSAGVVFLRRNPAAQLWSLVYLICLHFWVMYILMSHSQVSDDTSSGAVISLESINKTTGA